MSFWQIFCPSSVGECVWARGPKDTFDWSAQEKSPCEVDINEGLVNGRVWRKQQRGRGRHAVLDMKNDCFMRHNDSWLDDSSLEPREKNHVCGSATYAWDWCSVYTPVAYKGIAIACKRNTLTLRWKKKYRSHQLDVCDHEEDCHHEDGCHPEEEELADGFELYHLQPVFGSTRSEPSSCQANGWPGRCRTCSLGWSLVLDLPDSWYGRSFILLASW